MSGTLVVDDDEYLDEWQQPQTTAASREAVADLQLVDEHGAVSHEYELRTGDNIIGREDSCDIALTDDATVSTKHACISQPSSTTPHRLPAPIELQSASIPASSFAAPFFTPGGGLLDLDAITVTDLHSSNSTRLLASLSVSAAQPPIRLQPDKPRVLRHQQLLSLGKQRARFVLRQYEQGVQRAKQRPDSRHTSPVVGDPSDATQAYYATEEEKDEANLPMHDQATIAYVDDIDEPPQSARHHSAYDDSSDDEQQNAADANETQAQPAAAEGAEEEEKTEVKHDDDDPAVDLSYEVELDLVEDEQAKGAKPASQPAGLRGEGSETSPIIMSFASSHSSNGNDEVEDQQPLSALAHSHSNPTDAAGNKKASARTRVKQPSMVVTAEEQRSSMEEEGREHSRKAEQEKEKKLRQEAEEQTAAFEREVQAKAKQREEKRREEEAEERKQEEEQRKLREQQEADRRRQAQQEENERVKREAKEKREADKREKERREREQQEEEEEERERKRQENVRKAQEERKNAEEERKRAEAAAAAAEEEAKRRSEAEEEERVERMRQEDEERQRQLMAVEKQRLQQMAVSQLGWKSKPSKKGPAQPTNKTSPASKKATNNHATSPRGKRQAKTDESKQEDIPVEQQKAHDEKEAGVSEQKVEEEKDTKSRRGKRKSAGEADDQPLAGSEQKRRASRRQTAEVGRVIPIPITQPAEEQWDGAEFSPAVAYVHRADVEKEQERGEKRMEEEKSEAEPENPMVTTAEQAEQTEHAELKRSTSTKSERVSSRGKRKREDERREEEEESRQHMDNSHTDNTTISTSAHQPQPEDAAAGNKAKGHLDNSVESNARSTVREQGRRTRKEVDATAAQDNIKANVTEVEDSAEELAVAVDQQPAPPNDSSHLSTRSTATLAAMDVLEDMDAAQALATDKSMATTDEEVSPANTAVTPKRKRGRPRKKPVESKAAGEKEVELEAAGESSSEGKSTAKRGKSEVDTSIAEENPITDRRGTRYSHRTRSASNVDDETPAIRTSSSASTPTHATRRTGSKPTTPSSSTAHKRSTSSSPSTSSDDSSSAPVLLFTAIDHTSYNADIARLHGTITTDPLLATHLITNKVRRTDKFLIAYSVTPHLQSLQWLERCLRSARWGEEEGGRLVDEEAEGKWGFVLSERRVRSGWMAGWQVWCSDSVVPSRASMKGIVEAAGGQMREAVVEAKKARSEEKVLVIGCEEDKAACMEWTRAGHTVYDKEILLTGVLRQRVELDQHILYQQTTASTGKPSAKGRKR